jgi:hypothetical protein
MVCGSISFGVKHFQRNLIENDGKTSLGLEQLPVVQRDEGLVLGILHPEFAIETGVFARIW